MPQNKDCSITGSAICFRRHSFSPIQLPDNTSPNVIPDSSSLMFRLLFEVSFITEFHLEGCQNSQKVKVVPRLFSYKQILLSNIWLKLDFFSLFFYLQLPWNTSLVKFCCKSNSKIVVLLLKIQKTIKRFYCFLVTNVFMFTYTWVTSFPSFDHFLIELWDKLCLIWKPWH